MSVFNPKTSDPQEAIRHRLRFYASRTRPCIPDIGTVQFLKARLLPARQLHRITFQDMEGQRWRWLFFLTQREDSSWVVQTSSGGLETEQPSVPTDKPSVLFSSGQQTRLDRYGNVTYEFRAGGEVYDNGFHVARVRLNSSNGRILEDTVQDGLVLFWSPENIGLSVQAELYNHAGQVVSEQPMMHIPSLPSNMPSGIFHPLHTMPSE